jgi:hypothetical protein
MRKVNLAALATTCCLAVAIAPLSAQSWVAGQPGTVQVGINAAAAGQSTMILPWPGETPQTTANSPAAAAMPADPAYHGAPYVGALTPSPAAPPHIYPVCTAQLRDSCINPQPSRR